MVRGTSEKAVVILRESVKTAQTREVGIELG